MRVLALDGALGPFSAAVYDGERTVAEQTAGGDALERGLGLVAELLARARLTPATLDRIAVGRGPGSFTGVRIAISFAKGLALAHAVPLVGLTSYQLLAPGDAPLPLLIVVRGRRGVVSAQLQDAAGVRSASGTPSEVLAALVPAPLPVPLTVVGNTEDVHSAIAERGLVVRALPSRAENPAVAAIELALRVPPSASPHAVAPEYGELPAVTVPGTR